MLNQIISLEDLIEINTKLVNKFGGCCVGFNEKDSLIFVESFIENSNLSTTLRTSFFK